MKKDSLASFGIIEEKRQWKFWLSMLTIISVVIVSPWFTALFFTPTSTIFSVVIALMILLSISYKTEDIKVNDPKIWALGLSAYVLLTFLWSASLVNSIQVGVMQVSALLLFVLVLKISDSITKLIVPILLGIGIALFVFGMGAAVSWWSATDAVYGNHLLASVFQYHNTFAALELAIGVVAFMAATMYSKWWMNILGSAAFMVSVTSVLGSYSREVWVFAPFAYILAIGIRAYMQKSTHTVIQGIILVIFGIIASYFTLKALKNGISKDFIEALVVIIIGSIATSYFMQWFNKRSISTKKLSISAGAIALLVIGFVIVDYKHLLKSTSGLGSRIHSISFNSVSLQERFYYYKNAVHMWLNSPLFGSGGGTWNAKFQAFQTMPYWSTQAHSYIVDLLVNYGIIGFGLFIGLIVTVAYQFIKLLKNQGLSNEQKIYRSGFILAAVFMLLHAMFDFDFSFGYSQYIFWILLAMGVGNTIQPLEKLDSKSKNESDYKWVSNVLLLGVGIITIVFGGTNSAAQVIAQASNNPELSANAKLSYAQTASMFAPYDPNLQLSIAQYDMQTAMSSQDYPLLNRAWSRIQSAERYGYWNPSIQTQAAVFAYQLKHLNSALKWSILGNKDAPFNSTALSNQLGIELWDSAGKVSTDKSAAKQQLTDLITEYNNFLQTSKTVNLKLFPDAYPMITDASMQVYLGAAYYLIGDFNQSVKIMNPLLSKNRDQAAINLYEIVTVLDDKNMHVNNKLDALYMQQIKQNPSALAEFKYLAPIPIIK